MTGRGKVRHVPLRRCVVCRKSAPLRVLLRFTRSESGDWRPDPQRRAGGRGAWICEACARQPDRKSLRRFFRGQSTSIEAWLKAYSAADGGMDVR